MDDFPAAHSMDSGWFAVDRDGNLAHFDTGEAGAMPHDATFTTGEAGGDGDVLWHEHIAPWIARHVDAATVRESVEFSVLALFDTPDHARAAVARGAHVVEGNDRLVEFEELPDAREPFEVESMAGFIGLAPSMYDMPFEERLRAAIPVAFYEHGDYDIPGHYVRESSPVGAMPIPDDVRHELTPMDTSFAASPELHLADFYEQDECISWSQADLRTGEMPPPPPVVGFFGRLFKKKP